MAAPDRKSIAEEDDQLPASSQPQPPHATRPHFLPPTGFARELIARTSGPSPRYGTPEWEGLPASDPRKLAAVAVAAECWRDHCSTYRVAEDLLERMAEEDRAVLWRSRETSWDVRASLAACLPGWVDSPSHAELQRRRAET